MGVVGVLLVAAVVLGSVHNAAAADVQHGISLTKGCVSPTQIGARYSCTYTVRNINDEALDTLTITGLVDVVQAAPKSVSSGNVLSSLQLVFVQGTATTPPHCDGGSGAGTAASPYTGATSCTLPFGSRINVNAFSFYTVTAADFELPGHVLTDSAFLTWHDTCDGSNAAVPPITNCNVNPPDVSAASQSTISPPLAPTTTTTVHDASHNAVTTVDSGTTVHDFVSVSGGPGSPVPTGTVVLDWYTNDTCTAPASSTSAPIALGQGGTVDATGFAQGPLAAGKYAFKARYSGDSLYPASTGTCEPLTVSPPFGDANIQITPNGVNRVGQTHTFTAHVNVNSGPGFGNAPNGTTITFTKDSGPGTLAATSCTTSGGTGSCSVNLTSTTTGVSTVNAHTTVTVNGLTLTRNTDGATGNSGPATKTWVDARISIAPDAVNEVGKSHTFTVKLEKDTGTGTFVPAAGEHVTVTLTDSNGAHHTTPTGTCTSPGANTDAGGQCTITFTSASPGTVTGHASATVAVAGSAPFTVETGSATAADAVKKFVDANIQITPDGVNRVGETHRFTAHVNVNSGTGFVSAPAGTSLRFTIDSGPGSFATANPCKTVGGSGSCTIDLSSKTTGTTVVSAHVTLSVAGVSLTRHTDGKGANSGPATKLWWELVEHSTPIATNANGQNPTVVLKGAQGNGPPVLPGTPIHDKVFVRNAPGTPAAVPKPTGIVLIHLYPNLTCTGAEIPGYPVKVKLGANGTAESPVISMPGTNLCYQSEFQGRLGMLEPVLAQSLPPPAITIAKCPAAREANGSAKAVNSIWRTVNGKTVVLRGVKAKDCTKVSAPSDPSDQQTDATQQTYVQQKQAGQKMWTASFLITVINTGGVPLSSVQVTDLVQHGTTALSNDCSRPFPRSTMPAGTHWTFTCTVTRAAIPVEPSTIYSQKPCGYQNTANVVGSAPAGVNPSRVRDSDTSSVIHVCYTR